MRKWVMLAVAVAAAILATLLSPATPAQADQTLTLNFGPGGYDVIYAPPSGTLTVGGGGRISAQCSAVGARSNPVTARPACTTRQVPCPATANYCTVTLQGYEYVLVGQANWGGIAYNGGGFFNAGDTKPYNCPKATTCGEVYVADVLPGTTTQVAVFNLGNSPSLTSITGSIGEVVH